MPFDHQAQWIIIFVTILLYLATEAAEFKVVPLFRQPYTARPAITYESLIESNKRFRQWTNFDLDIFYKYLLKPLSKYVDQVRPYYYDKKLPQCESQSYDIDIRTARGCVLNVPTRIIRYLTILKDESMTRIEQLFDQHRTTAMRDFIHINLAVLHCFQDKYLTDLKPGTEEFRKLIGAGCLSSFSNAIGAFDITKIKHNAPRASGSKKTRAHFDGHHHDYNSGIGMICDGYGIAHNIIGPERGGCNDITIWYNSGYNKNIRKHFGNTKLLVDGIFRHAEGNFICSFPNPVNERQLRFNVMHILGRTMVEHVFGRQKGYWPIIARKYTLNLRWLPIIYRNVALLTNMLVMHQSPMRKV